MSIVRDAQIIVLMHQIETTQKRIAEMNDELRRFILEQMQERARFNDGELARRLNALRPRERM